MYQVNKDILNKIHPFFYLTSNEKQDLLKHSQYQTYEPNTIICHPEDKTNLDKLFLLCKGSVNVIVQSQIIGKIEAISYFGERAVFFNQPRKATITANQEIECLIIPGEYIIQLLSKNLRFCYAFAATLRNKQKIFQGFEDFIHELLEKRRQGNFQINGLLDRYKELVPVLHKHCQDEIIDFDALRYAIARLPKNITRLNLILLAEDLPAHYQQIQKEILTSAAQGKKKNFYQLSPGEMLIILRDELSDYIDIISKFCIYQIEIKKIISRLPQDLISEMIHYHFSQIKNKTDRANIIRKLPFSPEEIKLLKDIFPINFIRKLCEIILQNTEIHYQVLTSPVRYYSLSNELWVNQIQNLLNKKFAKNVLEDDLNVHIISSNTHSITNCLSHWVHHDAPHLIDQTPYHTLDNKDQIYAAIQHFLKKNPAYRREKETVEEQHGIYHLPLSHLSGVHASIIDVGKLSAHIDQRITLPSQVKNTIIFNLDHAYGKNAELIIRYLILLFGKQIRSVSIFSKAGGIIGQRGELMIPTHFIMQENDVNHAIPKQDLDEKDFRAVGYSQPIHQGPFLTVLGTLLQNHEMLMFYRHFWQVIGMEMEGGYFVQELNRAKLQNLLADDVITRFAYYISDTPLRAGESLASRMIQSKGIPAVYTISRAILQKIFNQTSSK